MLCYAVPKTAAHLETVNLEDDALPAPCAPHKGQSVALGVLCASVWWLTMCAQGKTSSGHQLHFEASDNNFTTQSQVLCTGLQCVHAFLCN